MWKQHEIELLCKLVQNCPSKKSWVHISKTMKTKSARQCYDFYTNRICNAAPCVGGHTKHHWTSEEVNRLLEKTDETSWKEFQAKHFPTMTIGQLKCKYKLLKSKGCCEKMILAD